MRSKLRRDIGLLKSYAAVSSLALVVVSVAAFRQATPPVTEFDEITVQRLNIVEVDGRTRLVLSNGERQAQVTADGQQLGPDRERPAGMIFFNEVGDEVGGLIFRGAETSDGHSALVSLTFDRWKQDQTVVLRYSERNGRYWSGLTVTDRSEQPLTAIADLLVRLDEAASETERARLRQEIMARQPRPFDEQIVGGLAMHQGRIAEMQTGEGKTLAAVAPVALNALAGHGVHVLTFNDYLARRDAAWMGPVYRMLCLTVGCVQEGMPPAGRRAAYGCDVTYVTAREAGFDLLRDGLCLSPAGLVHRPFQFALVDEADSILIDEARIPLVIAGHVDESGIGLRQVAGVARRLTPETDFTTDEHRRNVFLDVWMDGPRASDMAEVQITADPRDGEHDGSGFSTCGTGCTQAYTGAATNPPRANRKSVRGVPDPAALADTAGDIPSVGSGRIRQLASLKTSLTRA